MLTKKLWNRHHFLKKVSEIKTKSHERKCRVGEPEMPNIKLEVSDSAVYCRIQVVVEILYQIW